MIPQEYYDRQEVASCRKFVHRGLAGVLMWYGCTLSMGDCFARVAPVVFVYHLKVLYKVPSREGLKSCYSRSGAALVIFIPQALESLTSCAVLR